MENFIFQSATKIIFGRGTETQVGKEVKNYSGNILLVHYGDEFIKNSGILERVMSSLKESGINYTELTGIKPNPLIGSVYDGIGLCRENKIDFVLAVGGGSVIDTVKAIVAGVLYNGDVWDLYYEKAGFSEAF